jgi:hypothetical protein
MAPRDSDILKSKSIKDSKQTVPENEDTINVDTGTKGDGWGMPDKFWLDMEAEDKEGFFIHLELEDVKVDNVVPKKAEETYDEV